MSLWWAQCRGWEVTHLVSVLISGNDSMMFQIPGVPLVEHQARLTGLDWVVVESTGEEEVEILDLERGLASLQIDGLVAGALQSDYQKSRIERMCQRLDIKSFTPLWHQKPLNHLRGLVDNGFKVMITGVSSEGLGADWLGRILDVKALNELQELSEKYRFNIDGEGGEYETIVLAGPHMKGSLILDYDVNWDGSRGHIVVRDIRTEL